MKTISRRTVLRGAGTVSLALPLLEGLTPRQARAAGTEQRFAIFFRQANGCASQQQTEVGSEPERFWPHADGALTPANVEGRAVGELVDYLDRLLVVGNVNMVEHEYGDGHARGAFQGLTAQGPAIPGLGGASEAAGESLDHRIGRELNEGGRDSLFLYAGSNTGWLGGACISYRGPSNRRAPLNNPVTAYMNIMGLDQETHADLVARQRSVNDLVRDEMAALLASAKLSALDRERLEVHRAAIRDLETALSCTLAEDRAAELDGLSAGYQSVDGDQVLAATRAHMEVAALAVACGFTRSVAIQVGNGNDGITRYRDLETGELMENYHFVSHRRLSHDAEGEIIPEADRLHHQVDLQFARTFRHLLDVLSEYPSAEGGSLLDHGFALWYNDLGNGPAHSPYNIPCIIAGSAGGYFRQGEFVRIGGPVGAPTHKRLLNTLGASVGLQNAAGEPLDDFGDPRIPGGNLSELQA